MSKFTRSIKFREFFKLFQQHTPNRRPSKSDFLPVIENFSIICTKFEKGAVPSSNVVPALSAINIFAVFENHVETVQSGTLEEIPMHNKIMAQS